MSAVYLIVVVVAGCWLPGGFLTNGHSKVHDRNHLFECFFLRYLHSSHLHNLVYCLGNQSSQQKKQQKSFFCWFCLRLND